ncbi:YppG family protein [Gottfriedia acidiceleris]|uniref:YppG family protein n=1 Tax=Bacillaceae TaxID=186817 RepID=UPI00256FD377|nr:MULTISPECIES: YppG family protein [unclassified Bacillus (in: firmicutes)]
MRSQMFPPNHSDNSFEWFRKQNQVIDENFNFPEMNQISNENQRYYGNTIQPFSQNHTMNTLQSPVQSQQTQHAQSTQLTQPVQPVQPTQSIQQSQMIEPSPYGGPSTQTGSYDQSQMQYAAPQHFSMQNPTVSYNQGYQYDPNYYGMMQNQYPYMPMYSSQFGNQTNYLSSPQNHQYSMQPQHAQMLQQGPFTTPPMFAPSTPYPTQPKKLNQQNNNGQSFQFSSILNQFKNGSGSYDVPKMMSTAGQMMNTMNQVGGLFKQIGVLFK